MSTEEVRALKLLSLVPYGRVATSMRAMPFVTPARHIVTDGGVLLRMHAGHGYHRACGGGVVAYGADNFGNGEFDLWSVQLTGTAEIIVPTARELEQFGGGPHHVDGQPFEPVYMCLVPQFVTVHMLDYSQERRPQHAA
ncbi:pyridoxamine 5'-phosphate oxidase family protein [Streptomyces sp. NPDC051569]|uniref:pyridoxamine 5'-phosphate oxidase family protein n=1 Tax=Streptomyces sp. NPDC051569 TaxID=3365661 RepID=UPI0037BCE86A